MLCAKCMIDPAVASGGPVLRRAANRSIRNHTSRAIFARHLDRSGTPSRHLAGGRSRQAAHRPYLPWPGRNSWLALLARGGGTSGELRLASRASVAALPALPGRFLSQVLPGSSFLVQRVGAVAARAARRQSTTRKHGTGGMT